MADDERRDPDHASGLDPEHEGYVGPADPGDRPERPSPPGPEPIPADPELRAAPPVPSDPAVDLTKPAAEPTDPADGESTRPDAAEASAIEVPPVDTGEPTAGSDAAADGAATEADAAGRRGRRRRSGKPRRKAPWWELPALVGLAILIAILVKSFVVQPFYIPSQSMEKTLHGCPGCSGDRILVGKVVYDFRDPHPGDIVVFDAPPGWNEEPRSTPPSNPVLRVVRGFGQLIGFVPPDGLVLVKRVIAIGGQTVRGKVVDGKDVVQVSDHGTSGPWRTLDEPFVYLTSIDTRGDFGPVTVPKGRLWVMGDHRDESADSRYHCGSGGSNGPDGSSCNAVTSTVPIDDVIGKAFVIAWPPSRWRTLGTPATFTQAAAADGVVPLGLVVPLFLVRRRRRRRR